MTTPKRHLLITGLFRTGTTFLILFYHSLGFNTGVDRGIHKLLHGLDYKRKHRGPPFAGFEVLREHGVHTNFKNAIPRLKGVEVLKHPWGYGDRYTPQRIIEYHELTFEYVILTSRDFNSMIASQMAFGLKRGKFKLNRKEQIEGCLRNASGAKQQQLEEWLETTDSKVLHVEFPRSVTDFEYLWQQLEPSLSSKVSFEEAERVWTDLSDPSFVNF